MNMTISKPKMAKKRKQHIEELQQEFEEKSAIYKKNKEQHNIQVQLGLFEMGYPRTSPMYSTTLSRLGFDIKEEKIKLKYEFLALNPMHAYETDPEFVEIKRQRSEERLKNLKNDFEEIKSKVEEVKNNMKIVGQKFL